MDFSFEHATTEYNNIDESTKVRLVQFRRIGKGCMSYLEPIPKFDKIIDLYFHF